MIIQGIGCWITVDTSRAALARTRIMSAGYPFYLLADSRDSGEKGEVISGKCLVAREYKPRATRHRLAGRPNRPAARNR